MHEITSEFLLNTVYVCGLGFWFGSMALLSTSFPVTVPGLCRYCNNFYWIFSIISHQQNLIPRTCKGQLADICCPVSENSPYMKPNWVGVSLPRHMRMQQDPVPDIVFLLEYQAVDNIYERTTVIPSVIYNYKNPSELKEHNSLHSSHTHNHKYKCRGIVIITAVAEICKNFHVSYTHFSGGFMCPSGFIPIRDHTFFTKLTSILH